ncbi:uncharacterized protein [Amphiura filiformis]|uniref:uncharacterized protein n=1 Tax=Amphiura filiformis TaxID=82378 RepID=UPI003B2266E5
MENSQDVHNNKEQKTNHGKYQLAHQTEVNEQRVVNTTTSVDGNNACGMQHQHDDSEQRLPDEYSTCTSASSASVYGTNSGVEEQPTPVDIQPEENGKSNHSAASVNGNNISVTKQQANGSEVNLLDEDSSCTSATIHDNRQPGENEMSNSSARSVDDNNVSVTQQQTDVRERKLVDGDSLYAPSSIHGNNVSVVEQQNNVAEKYIVSGDSYKAQTIVFNIGNHKKDEEASGAAVSGADGHNVQHQVLQHLHNNNCRINGKNEVIINTDRTTKRTGLSAASHVPYKLLCLKIKKDLDLKEGALKDLIYIITEDKQSGCGIPNGTRIKSAEQLISELEECQLLGPRNVLYLQKLLNDIGETQLAADVNKYAQESNDHVLHIQEATHSAIASSTIPVEIILKENQETTILKMWMNCVTLYQELVFPVTAFH